MKSIYFIFHFKKGLFEDDIFRETSVVEQAIKRLPQDVYQERQYRLARALNASAKQHCLPKEEWTKYEDVCLNNFSKFNLILNSILFQDLPYLKTYIADCLKEEQEKEDWENGNINI